MCSRPTTPSGGDVGISRLTAHSTPCLLPRPAAGQGVFHLSRDAAIARTITVPEEAHEALERCKRAWGEPPRPCPSPVRGGAPRGPPGTAVMVYVVPDTGPLIALPGFS